MIRVFLISFVISWWFLHIPIVQSTSCISGEVRLVGSDRSNYHGTVEVCYNNSWTTVCDNGWDNNDAKVVCKQLGFIPIGYYAVDSSTFGQGTGLALLDNVQCVGTESSLFECANNGIGEANCWLYNSAGVLCSNSTCTTGEIRLAGTDLSSYHGRVEVCYDNIWGTVCDNFWDKNDANVVCKQLGFFPSGNHAVRHSDFGPGTGIIWLENVQCNGTESSLLNECAHNGIGISSTYCDHFADAGVICTNNTICTDGAIRLAGINSSSNRGRLELCYGNVWGTVCSDSWTNNEADVVCRQLGFSASGIVSSTKDRSSGPSILSEISCNGTIPNLLLCFRSDISWYYCPHLEEVEVMCISKPSGNGQMIPPKIYSSCPSDTSGLQEEVLKILASNYSVSPLGLSRQHPAQSCNQIHDANPSSISGFYWIGAEPIIQQQHCIF